MRVSHAAKGVQRLGPGLWLILMRRPSASRLTAGATSSVTSQCPWLAGVGLADRAWTRRPTATTTERRQSGLPTLGLALVGTHAARR
jgi:hypothetical protein